MHFGLPYNYKKGTLLKIFAPKNVSAVSAIEFGMAMKTKTYKSVKGKLVILKSN